MNDHVVCARNLSKDFDEGGVLDDIDITIPEGETTLLMGPNGAGKTILLACLCGGLTPSSGSVSVFGEPPTDVRRKFNFMLQGGLALPELSGRENVRFYADLHPRATDGWRAIAEQMDLLEDLDRVVRDYSGGMVRKLELALTLSVDVPLYLLDEPTAELDLTAINQFHALLQEHLDDGKTVVMTSHTPMDAKIADRIVFVQHGDIVADGAPDELLASVPPVLRVVNTASTDPLTEFVRTGRFFESSQDRRGFLEPGVSIDMIEDELPDDVIDEVSIDDTTYADLFNYYTRIAPITSE